MRIMYVVLLVFLSGAAFAQSKRISHWYFGFGAGLDFNSGTPVKDRSGIIESLEGMAIMSDEQGNLLFYSNGQTVWSRNHVFMPHGTIIKGDQSSTQSTLIVPLPGNNHVYYLFSSTANGPSPGLYYNVVDMNLDGGRGDIDIAAGKDVQMMQLSSEQLAGTMHCNATDFWILGREVNADSLKFYAWLLTANGLSVPIISSFALPNNVKYGTLDFSPDGRLLSLATLGFPHQQMDCYLFDFDIKTGVLTQRLRIGSKNGECLYSSAFSPDKTRLYISTFSAGPGFHYQYLSQFDLTANDVTASRVDIDSIYNLVPNPGFFGQLRLGPDQQIYVSRSRTDFAPTVNPNTLYALDSIDVIHFPNRRGTACGYQRNYLWLDHQPTMLGLPNFISNYTMPVPPLPFCVFDPGEFADTIADVCEGRTVRFAYALPPAADSVLWNFGDININGDNTSTALTPSHQYLVDGRYLVTLVVFHDGAKDTVLRKNIDVAKGRCDVHLPSAFSPDGDGNNDVFGLIHGDNITRFSMEIYNRWGQKLFSSNDRHAGWDGFSHGQAQPADIYVWCIRYDVPQAKGIVLRGTVLLTRRR